MHHFPLHIGDYNSKASHLTLLEDGVFNRLLRVYYATETPLPVEVRAVQRLAGARRQDELAAVETVLFEFFVLADDGWHNEKADRVIAAYHAKGDKARKSAEARWNARATVALADFDDASAMRTHSERSPNASDSHGVRNANQNQEPITRTKEAKATVEPSVRQPDRFPEFWDAYPNKQGKQEAWKRWRKDRLDAIADTILAHVAKMRAQDDGWQRGYAPMGSTYLNQARWTDEPRGPPRASQPIEAPSKTMQAVYALEDMKNGLVHPRDHHGHSEALVLEAAGVPGLGHDSRDRRRVD